MRIAFIALLASVTALSPAASAGSYTFTTLNPPGATGGAQGNSINNAGAVVGLTFPAGSAGQQSFLYSGGAYSTITVPGSDPGSTQALGINNLGQIAGGYSLGGVSHGFVLTAGQPQTIDYPGGSGSTLFGINDHGQVVGSTSLNMTSNGSAGFSYVNGQYTTFSAPGAAFGTGFDAVNNAGAIVGIYVDAQFNTHGFLLQNGQFTEINDPNANFAPFGGGSAVGGINNNGEIVGDYIDSSGLSHGFVYQNGVFTTVDDPLGVGGTSLSGVNDAGRVVGTYTDANGNQFAFVASPAVPEPASLTLLAVAGAALAVRRLRRRG